MSRSIVCSYFGQKSSKSSWKFNVDTTFEEQEAILELYECVYRTVKIPYKEISL